MIRSRRDGNVRRLGVLRAGAEHARSEWGLARSIRPYENFAPASTSARRPIVRPPSWGLDPIPVRGQLGWCPVIGWHRAGTLLAGRAARLQEPLSPEFTGAPCTSYSIHRHPAGVAKQADRVGARTSGHLSRAASGAIPAGGSLSRRTRTPGPSAMAGAGSRDGTRIEGGARNPVEIRSGRDHTDSGRSLP